MTYIYYDLKISKKFSGRQDMLKQTELWVIAEIFMQGNEILQFYRFEKTQKMQLFKSFQ